MAPWRGPKPALPPLPLPPGAGGPLRAAPGGPPLERETGYQGGYIGLMVRAWRRGRALENRATTYLLGGRSRAHREAPGPIGGRCAPPPGPGVRAPPFGGALLQHRPPPTRFCRGHGLQLCPLTAACPLIAGASPPGPLTVSGGQPTAYRALPGGRYPRAVCTAPGGPRLDPWGPCRETTKPHADRDSMRFGSPGGRALYNRSGVTGLSWIYRDIHFAGVNPLAVPIGKPRLS